MSFTAALLMLVQSASGAPAMAVIDEATTRCEEPPPHGAIGMSTAYRISDAAPQPRAMEFRRRILHRGAVVGIWQRGKKPLSVILSYPNGKD